MRIRIATASVAVFLLAWMLSSALQPRRESGILNIDPPTPYFHYLPSEPKRGLVLVVHGLDASKEVMHTISAAMADAGYEVYSVDLPGHGDSTIPFNASIARLAVENILNSLGHDCIVVGHSLGAGLLIDVAQDTHFSKMVLLSPPPMPVKEIQADHVLLIMGGFDVARIRAFAPVLTDIGDPRIESRTLAWAAHSSAIFNPLYLSQIIGWIGGEPRTGRIALRLFLVILMLVSAACAGISLIPGTSLERYPANVPATIVRYVAACGFAILILKFVVPLSWLRFFATDYVISFLFLAGVIVWVQAPVWPRTGWRAISAAIAAAGFVIGVMGFIGSSQIVHMTLSDGRLWRFPFVVAAGLPLFVVDEMVVRKISGALNSAVVALVTRALLWAFLMTGVLLYNRSAAFIVLIAHLMVFFWIALWFGAYLVHRHTRDPFAAALFAALVQGWAFSAWFVLR